MTHIEFEEKLETLTKMILDIVTESSGNQLCGLLMFLKELQAMNVTMVKILPEEELDRETDFRPYHNLSRSLSYKMFEYLDSKYDIIGKLRAKASQEGLAALDALLGKQSQDKNTVH